MFHLMSQEILLRLYAFGYNKNYSSIILLKNCVQYYYSDIFSLICIHHPTDRIAHV